MDQKEPAQASCRPSQSGGGAAAFSRAGFGSPLETLRANVSVLTNVCQNCANCLGSDCTVPIRGYGRLTMFDCTFAIVSSRPGAPDRGGHAVNPRARRKVSRARAVLPFDTRTSVPSQARRSLFVMAANPYPAGLSATATGAIPTSLRGRPHPLTAAKCANFVPIAGSPLKPLLGAARPEVVMLANTQDQTLEMPCRPISDPFPTITATSVSLPGISNPAGITLSQTEEANIARVKVDLPKQLTSRLTTLQKACTRSTSKQTQQIAPKHQRSAKQHQSPQSSPSHSKAPRTSSVMETKRFHN
jgi:hypothetical protein